MCPEPSQPGVGHLNPREGQREKRSVWILLNWIQDGFCFSLCVGFRLTAAPGSWSATCCGYFCRSTDNWTGCKKTPTFSSVCRHFSAYSQNCFRCPRLWDRIHGNELCPNELWSGWKKAKKKVLSPSGPLTLISEEAPAAPHYPTLPLYHFTVLLHHLPDQEDIRGKQLWIRPDQADNENASQQSSCLFLHDHDMTDLSLKT